MLKTNSKIAREKIRAMIMENANTEDYANGETEYKEICKAIYADFRRVTDNDGGLRRMSYQDKFSYYLSCLPGVLDFGYHYTESAVKVLGDILEETEEERNKFTEDRAVFVLDYMVYSEVLKAI